MAHQASRADPNFLFYPLSASDFLFDVILPPMPTTCLWFLLHGSSLFLLFHLMIRSSSLFQSGLFCSFFVDRTCLLGGVGGFLSFGLNSGSFSLSLEWIVVNLVVEIFYRVLELWLNALFCVISLSLHFDGPNGEILFSELLILFVLLFVLDVVDLSSRLWCNILATWCIELVLL